MENNGNFDCIKFTIYGNPTTKKNSSCLINKGGKTIIIPSKQYRNYRDDVVKQGIPKLGINYPVNVQAIYYRDSRRRVDLCNLHEALCDILQDTGTVEDDNCRIIVSMDGSFVSYDKENPRTEITITPKTEWSDPFEQ